MATHIMSEEISGIREALLLGLSAYGEADRVRRQQEFVHAEFGQETPEPLRIKETCGKDNAIGVFVYALEMLEAVQDTIETKSSNTEGAEA